MIRYVALVRTGVSEELKASFFRVTRIGELSTTAAVSNLIKLVSIVLPSKPHRKWLLSSKFFFEICKTLRFYESFLNLLLYLC
jgi:hypothetical protein